MFYFFFFLSPLSFEVNGVSAKPFEPRDIVLVLDVLLFIFVKETCKGFVLCQWRKKLLSLVYLQVYFLSDYYCIQMQYKTFMDFII